MEIENKQLKGENIKLKSHIYNFVSESGDKFCAATDLTVDSFNNLLEFLNPSKDSCNTKFYDTSRSCNDTGSSKSGPKPKL